MTDDEVEVLALIREYLTAGLGLFRIWHTGQQIVELEAAQRFKDRRTVAMTALVRILGSYDAVQASIDAVRFDYS